jgi:phospholipid/cholesterol/gamma-HCH transport system permease protein
MEHLVLPRVLGLFVMMPLLTIYSMFIGILGGLIVAVAMLDLSATQFTVGLLTPLTLADGLLGVFKGSVFGLIIGVSGCMRGLQVEGDAGAVGRAATSAVVTGITLIILANALVDWLAALFGNLKRSCLNSVAIGEPRGDGPETPGPRRARPWR